MLLKDEIGLMRRHQQADDSFSPTEAAKGSDLKTLGGKLVQHAQESLHRLHPFNLSEPLPLLPAEKLKLKSGMLAASKGLTTADTKTQGSHNDKMTPGNVSFMFDDQWLEENHKLNTMIYECSNFAYQARCATGELSGFDGLDPRDCWGSCISRHKQGSTRADSGFVARRYSIPSRCFCCDLSSNVLSSGNDEYGKPFQLYDVFKCWYTGTTVPPPYVNEDTKLYTRTTTTTAAR